MVGAEGVVVGWMPGVLVVTALEADVPEGTTVAVVDTTGTDGVSGTPGTVGTSPVVASTVGSPGAGGTAGP